MKKNNWMFHRKYKTWFKKIPSANDKPLDANSDQKDVGTYIYFDYETGWQTRVKENFEFDLQYLENELIIPENLRRPQSIFGETLFSSA